MDKNEAAGRIRSIVAALCNEGKIDRRNCFAIGSLLDYLGPETQPEPETELDISYEQTACEGESQPDSVL